MLFSLIELDALDLNCRYINSKPFGDLNIRDSRELLKKLRHGFKSKGSDSHQDPATPISGPCSNRVGWFWIGEVVV
jgi:hypothetical protein